MRAAMVSRVAVKSNRGDNRGGALTASEDNCKMRIEFVGPTYLTGMPPKHSAKKVASLTKAQFLAEASAKTDLSKSQASHILDAFIEVIAAELKGGRPVTLPGLVKITLQSKPAKPARMGRNPFTGAEIMIKAKPAHKVVKVRPIKALKDLA